ncbi:hypothetical protein AK830_g7697 [Neonectria ditissima]|uniref:Zn(2)-C6 fungal-type domain-containing protein n=1 Tax=Neonectria ditissima TaxID=78410 RepID=A0A0P7AM41_9HYPO|nr:hypothetical protein AK830_g7697 [Neonectria ditissima]
MLSHDKAKATSKDRLASSSRTSQARPRDSVEGTKRAARACDDCRRLKEKCNGGVPCDRCKKSGNKCKFSDSFKRPRILRQQSAEQITVAPSAVGSDPMTFFEVERIRALEHIVHYFTGIDDYGKHSLQQVIATFQSEETAKPDLTPVGPNKCDDPKALKNTTSVESIPVSTIGTWRGESPDEDFSHSDFSRRIQQKVEGYLEKYPRDSLQAPKSYVVGGRLAPMEHLLSRDSVVYDAVSLFPPADTSFLLLDVFFEFAQTNYFYVDEEVLRGRLTQFYSSSANLGISDAPWVCIALMMFAVGTQFVHLTPTSAILQERRRASTDTHTLGLAMNDALASAFYRKACSLIPDVLAIASVESVQTFLLLGIYTLPFDPAGLACNYLGIAMKLAIQNRMHQKYHQGNLEALQIEFRKRIWWTAYMLERLVLPSMAGNITLMLRNADKSQRGNLWQQLLKLKKKLESYWELLPEDIFCKDLAPEKPLFRSNIHLALTYHLVHIFIGRSLIFKETRLKPGESCATEWPGVRDELIENCVTSAILTIDLCQLLQDKAGLSKSSYTEFTSCYAAVLAIVGKRIFTTNSELEDASRRGLELLKNMAVGIFSKGSEKRGLEILEMAVQKLDGSDGENTTSPDENGYAEFRNWVAMQQIVPRETPLLPGQDHSVPLIGGGPGDTARAAAIPNRNANGIPSFNVSTLGELGSLPGLDEWFVGGLTAEFPTTRDPEAGAVETISIF